MQFDNPFPGMNPYLERSDLWPDFHNDLIAQLREELGPRLPVRYRIALEERVEIGAAVGPPLDLSLAIPDALVIDEHPAPETVPPGPTAALAAPSKGATAVRVPVPREIRVTWLRVEALPERDVVTVVEVLSPANKSPGRERQRYVRKREAIFAGGVNLVEIDLLRAGEPMPFGVSDPFRRLPRSRFRGLAGPGCPPAYVLRPAGNPQILPAFATGGRIPGSGPWPHHRQHAPQCTLWQGGRVSRTPARTAMRTESPGLDREQGRNVSACGIANATSVHGPSRDRLP